MKQKKDFNLPKTQESSNTWLTPPSLIEKLGKFDLDPCASVGVPEELKCAETNFTIEDDGLSKEWFGRIFLNPPYGSEIVPWMKRMSDNKHKGLALTFARTDTRWFHEYVLNSAKYMFLFKGRLKFWRYICEFTFNNGYETQVVNDESNLSKFTDFENAGLGKITVSVKEGQACNAASCLIAWDESEYDCLKSLEEQKLGKLLTIH